METNSTVENLLSNIEQQQKESLSDSPPPIPQPVEPITGENQSQIGHRPPIEKCQGNGEWKKISLQKYWQWYANKPEANSGEYLRWLASEIGNHPIFQHEFKHIYKDSELQNQLNELIYKHIEKLTGISFERSQSESAIVGKTQEGNVVKIYGDNKALLCFQYSKKQNLPPDASPSEYKLEVESKEVSLMDEWDKLFGDLENKTLGERQRAIERDNSLSQKEKETKILELANTTFEPHIKISNVENDPKLSKKEKEKQTKEIMEASGIKELTTVTVGHISDKKFLESKEFHQWNEFREVAVPVEIKIETLEKWKLQLVDDKDRQAELAKVESEIKKEKKQLRDINAFYKKQVGKEGLETINKKLAQRKELLRKRVLRKIKRGEPITEQEERIISIPIPKQSVAVLTISYSEFKTRHNESASDRRERNKESYLAKKGELIKRKFEPLTDGERMTPAQIPIEHFKIFHVPFSLMLRYTKNAGQAVISPEIGNIEDFPNAKILRHSVDYLNRETGQWENVKFPVVIVTAYEATKAMFPNEKVTSALIKRAKRKYEALAKKKYYIMEGSPFPLSYIEEFILEGKVHWAFSISHVMFAGINKPSEYQTIPFNLIYDVEQTYKRVTGAKEGSDVHTGAMIALFYRIIQNIDKPYYQDGKPHRMFIKSMVELGIIPERLVYRKVNGKQKQKVESQKIKKLLDNYFSVFQALGYIESFKIGNFRRGGGLSGSVEWISANNKKRLENFKQDDRLFAVD